MSEFFHSGYAQALVLLGVEKRANYGEAARRMLGGAAAGAAIGGIRQLARSADDEVPMMEVGKHTGVGALGGLGLGAVLHGFKSSDPAPAPVRIGVGGLLGGGIGAAIPYLLGVRDAKTLQRTGGIGAAGGAGIGLLASLVNPHREHRQPIYPNYPQEWAER